MVKVVTIFHDVIDRRIFGRHEILALIALDGPVWDRYFDPCPLVQCGIRAKRRIVLKQVFEAQVIKFGDGEEGLFGLDRVEDVLFFFFYDEPDAVFGREDNRFFRSIRLAETKRREQCKNE